MLSINRVIISGNLTADPELRELPSGTTLGKMRVAVNERRKVNDEWTDIAHYFNVTVWGAQAENVAEFLSKGSPVLVEGRLQYHEWTDDDDNKRSQVEITGERVIFLSGGRRDESDSEPDEGKGKAKGKWNK